MESRRISTLNRRGSASRVTKKPSAELVKAVADRVYAMLQAAWRRDWEQRRTALGKSHFGRN